MPRLLLLWALLCTGPGLCAAPAVRVLLIEDAGWSADNFSRSGAAEFEILLQIARLREQRLAVGIVAVADRHGGFGDGTRRALAAAHRIGVPVVKVSPHPQASEADADWVSAGPRNAAEASFLLATCLDAQTATAPVAFPRLLAAIRQAFTPAPPQPGTHPLALSPAPG